MKVLVCDDLKDRCKEIVEEIGRAGRAGLDVVSLVEAELTSELNTLFGRVNTCLNDPKACKPTGKLRFDDTDLVIVDNNLAHLDIKGTRLTAESIIGYVRAFTAAPYIVSLNKNPDIDFDLRYLIGDFETRADVALNTNHMANPALWTGNPADGTNGFLPSYWPRLLDAAAIRRKQIAFVRDRLDEPVFATFGFPTEASNFLSLHAQGTLSPSAVVNAADGDSIPIDKLTFRDVFVGRNRSLPDKQERESLSDAAKSGNKDVHEAIARVVAADIDLWFRRDVLGPQEALVDVPHLLMRLPFLLGKRVHDIEQWNNAVMQKDAPFGIESTLFDKHLAKEKFKLDVWVPRPSFWWPSVKADEKLNELFFKPDQNWPDVVFCEDRTAFAERSGKSGEVSPTEFSAEFEGSWARRYVAKIKGVRYKPLSRFAV